MSIDLWQVVGRYFVASVFLLSFAMLFVWLAVGVYRDCINHDPNLVPAGIVINSLAALVITATVLLFANTVGPVLHFAVTGAV